MGNSTPAAPAAAKSGVVYLLTGTQLAARLVVSLHTLRKWYDGPVTIFTTRAESHRIGQLIAEDRRLGAEARPLEERDGPGYNSSYMTKIAAVQDSPYARTVFFDADTLIVGSVGELFRAAAEADFTATAFCDWKTTDPHIIKRFRKWDALREGIAATIDIARLVRTLTRVALPAINSGVFAARCGAPILSEWEELAFLGRELWLPDEIALQILLLRHAHQLLGGHFNCHPQAPNIPDVRVWHFVGATHLRPGPTQDLWLPAYRECRELNLGRIVDWSRIEVQAPHPESARSTAKDE